VMVYGFLYVDYEYEYEYEYEYKYIPTMFKVVCLPLRC